MSLARALKEKGRIAKRLTAARELFGKLNSLREDSLHKAEAAEAYRDLLRYEGQYLRIKQAISRANGAISDQLVEMLVIRARMEYIQGLGCAESSVEDEWTRNQDGSQTRRHVRVPRVVIISERRRQEMERELEQRLDSLQDEVDQFNATHSLTVEL